MKKLLPDNERFWGRVAKGAPNECWEWPGTGGPHGYGVFRVGSLRDGTRSQVLAHRFAYHDANGGIPSGKHILHGCDNPKCVNPAHLRAGTHQDNMAEKIAKGRQRGGGSRIGIDHHASKLTPDIVRTIRASSATTKELAALFGVSGTSLAAARKGKTWRHVDGPCHI